MIAEVLLVGAVVMAIGGWGTAIWAGARCGALRRRLASTEAILASPERLRNALKIAEDRAWAEKVAVFDRANADAKERGDAAEMPEECVYSDCAREVTSTLTDVKGVTVGLCARHERAWARLDEDGRRRVRTGAGA